MDDNRERLIDILLREELGGERPPDLTGKIMARAFPRRGWRLRPFLAAASVLLAVGVLSWWFWPRYPEPRASGHYEIVSGNTVRRGATLRTKDKSAALELGGYTHVEIRPGTTLRIAGESYAENITLESGEVQCTVQSGKGAFAVDAPLGTVAVVGTEFVVRTGEEKAVLVRVTGGTVALSGDWGSTRLFAGEESTYLRTRDKKVEARSGIAIGTVAAKGEAWIEVKGPADDKPRRYMARWVGPGLERSMIETMNKLPLGTRVKVEWTFDERHRAVKIEVLQAPEGKEGDKKADEAAK